LLVRDATAVERAERCVRDRGVAHHAAPDAVADFAPYAMTEFIGRASSVLALNDAVDRLRQSRSTVLVRGETGTGKELVARALHFDGNNRSAPFIPLHCGAIAPELVESGLFGHEKGAFTGAQQSRDGLFRAADGGTIFLDEIAEMSLAVQVKLLRVLQRGEIRPVGSNQLHIVDVRIIAATNRDLGEMVRLGRFREDLFYRLQVVQLDLPPLRERIDDLPLLLEHFLRRANVRHGRQQPVTGVSRGALERLLAYAWPGNVRELEHVVEGAFALGCGQVLQEENLPEHIVLGRSSHEARASPRSPRLPRAVRSVPMLPVADVAAVDAAAEDEVPDFQELRRTAERQAILQALRQTQGDKVAAAGLLGMSRSTFYRRLQAYRL